MQDEDPFKPGYIDPAYLPLIKEIASKYKFLSRGRHRYTFQHKNFVIKVPRNYDGVLANSMEAYTFRQRGKSNSPGLPSFARCKLTRSNILIMEKLDCKRDIMPLLPVWALHIDCAQVGLDKKGRLCAYDYYPCHV